MHCDLNHFILFFTFLVTRHFIPTLQLLPAGGDDGVVSRMFQPKPDPFKTLEERLADRFVPLGAPGSRSITTLDYMAR